MLAEVENFETSIEEPSIPTITVKKNTFNDKLNHEAERNLIETRSVSSKLPKKIKDIATVWDIEPVDFSWQLYHPKPLKRNTREAIQPWLYDKYLREVDENEKISLGVKRTVESQILEDFFGSSQVFNLDDEEKKNFHRSFRVLTPNGARQEAARIMSFREGSDVFKNPSKHDFRGVNKKI